MDSSSSGSAAAVGAGGGVAACRQREGELPIAGVDLLNMQTGKMGKQQGFCILGVSSE